MCSAKVEFCRAQGVVEMTLSTKDNIVARSPSAESIARELQIQGVRFLDIEGVFSTDLPTSEKTLQFAGKLDFSEQMAALKLIAACASMGEVAPYSFPERRAKPRAEAMSVREQFAE